MQELFFSINYRYKMEPDQTNTISKDSKITLKSYKVDKYCGFYTSEYDKQNKTLLIATDSIEGVFQFDLATHTMKGKTKKTRSFFSKKS